jgi:hypothetical protein
VDPGLTPDRISLTEELSRRSEGDDQDNESPHQPKYNLSGAERRAHRFTEASDLLTVLPADKNNAAMVPGIPDYSRKVPILLEVKAHAKLQKNRKRSIESKTVLLKKLSCRRFTNLVCHEDAL